MLAPGVTVSSLAAGIAIASFIGSLATAWSAVTSPSLDSLVAIDGKAVDVAVGTKKFPGLISNGRIYSCLDPSCAIDPRRTLEQLDARAMINDDDILVSLHVAGQAVIPADHFQRLRRSTAILSLAFFVVGIFLSTVFIKKRGA